jgi:hypothetical protein
MGPAGFNGLQVALHHAIIAQGAHLTEVTPAYLAARFRKRRVPQGRAEALVLGDEFTQFTARDVATRLRDGRQFQG